VICVQKLYKINYLKLETTREILLAKSSAIIPDTQQFKVVSWKLKSGVLCAPQVPTISR